MRRLEDMLTTSRAERDTVSLRYNALSEHVSYQFTLMLQCFKSETITKNLTVLSFFYVLIVYNFSVKSEFTDMWKKYMYSIVSRKRSIECSHM